MRWEGELAELEAMGSGCPARLLAVLCRAQARHLTVVAQPHMQRAAAVRAAAAAVSVAKAAAKPSLPLEGLCLHVYSMWLLIKIR